MPYAAEIAAIQSQIDDDVEAHLYLTVYGALYVGHLGEVTAGAVVEEGEAEHAAPDAGRRSPCPIALPPNVHAPPYFH